MFDIGWSELLVIAVVALVVVGPKELPVLLRTIGQYVGIIRAHAAQFRAQVDEAIKDTELSELRDEMTELRDDVTNTMRETNETLGEEVSKAEDVLSSVDSDLSEGDGAGSNGKKT